MEKNKDEIMWENMELKDYVIEILKDYGYYDDKIESIVTPFIDELNSLNTKEELKPKFLELAKSLRNNGFVETYEEPIIWCNYALELKMIPLKCYSNWESGYGDKTTFCKLGLKFSILDLLKNIFYLIAIYKDANNKLDGIWLESIEDLKKEKKETIATELFGEIWLDLMPKEKLKNLKITCEKRTYFPSINVEDSEKYATNINSRVVYDLMLYALELVSKNNVQVKTRDEKIYYDTRFMLINPQSKELKAVVSLNTDDIIKDFEEKMKEPEKAENFILRNSQERSDYLKDIFNKGPVGL